MEDRAGLVVALDGPAGAGKSTVAKLLAHRLGLFVLDTGAMYRALALKALRQGIPPSDADRVSTLAGETEIRLEPAEPPTVLLDGEDVTTAIRTLEVGQAASELSVHPDVRRILVGHQKEVVAQRGCVLEGRDTTTVVAPDADLKVFLTASVEERARRRWLEGQARGSKASLQDVVLDVVNRDHRDYTRPDSPLTLAEDAAIVETFGLTPPEVVERLVRMLNAKG